MKNDALVMDTLNEFTLSVGDYMEVFGYLPEIHKRECCVIEAFSPMMGELKDVVRLELFETATGVGVDTNGIGAIENAEYGEAYALSVATFVPNDDETQIVERDGIRAYESFVIVDADDESITIVCMRHPLWAACMAQILSTIPAQTPLDIKINTIFSLRDEFCEECEVA